MSKDNSYLELAILKYCEVQKFPKTTNILNTGNVSQICLEKIFSSFFSKVPENKLSFTFKASNSQSLLKKRVSDMNVAECKTKIHKSEKVKSGNQIPESFLSLMDELCIDREKAEMFFKNSNQWTYIKSDRIIFCTKKGISKNITNTYTIFLLNRTLKSRALRYLTRFY